MNPLRRALSWKSWFYGAIVPGLARLGPGPLDRALGAIGRGVALARPGLRREILAGVRRVDATLSAGWDVPEVCRLVAANLPRIAARDLPIGHLGPLDLLDRFEVDGLNHLQAALDRGRGVVVVGSHLGAHLPALRWLDLQGSPLRLLVQPPRHVSAGLRAMFDREGPHPQSGFSLRRSMPPEDAARRLLAARSALRDGMMVYLGGDILWPGPNCREGRFLGVDRTFLAVWADLAALSGSPAVFLFARHAADGRYSLAIEPPRTVEPGGEGRAVADFLAALERQIARNPADAASYLLWPCFGPPAPSKAEANPRIGRRVAVAVGVGR